MDCPLCSKLTSLCELPDEEVVWQFPHSVAFLGVHQFYQGYCVLVARAHACELYHLPELIRRGYLDEMSVLAEAIGTAFQPHKLNYELLGNQVPHLHWHLFPRSMDDPERLKPVWLALERAEGDSSERARLTQGTLSRIETTTRLRQILQTLTTRANGHS